MKNKINTSENGARLEIPQERSVSLLGLKVEGIPSENAENVRQAIIILLNSNPKIFEGQKSPQEVLDLLGFSLPKIETTGKGRWAKAAERFRQNSMSPEAGRIMTKASQQFREEFAFNHDLEKNE